MDAPYWTYIFALIITASVDIAANLFLTKSNGFRRKRYGFIAILLVCIAFSFFYYAIKGIDLTVAYAMWGSFGILGTSLGGWIFFKQKMRGVAWIGVVMLIIGVLLMHS